MSAATWQAEVAAALRADDGRAAPAGLDAVDRARFRVYRNNVVVGLRDALASAYPVVRRLVGDAFFTATAKAFLRDHLPRRRSLALFGEGFPAFLATFPPAGALPYLADVARLERAVLEALHAADVEPLAAERLVDLGDAAATARFAPHPAARLVASPHPICSLWRAHQAEPGPIRIEARPETALVTRPADRVLMQSLSPAQGRFAAALLEGGDATAAAEAALGLDPALELASGWQPLLEGGAFAAVHGGDHR